MMTFVIIVFFFGVCYNEIINKEEPSKNIRFGELMGTTTSLSTEKVIEYEKITKCKSCNMWLVLKQKKQVSPSLIRRIHKRFKKLSLDTESVSVENFMDILKDDPDIPIEFC